ncbi:MAG: hypothetical protein SFT94_05575 [Pseudanabaenaceae cyanobacterium bins.68]|nr:hypothetical protein [Pseudanabaenaceae cyanobacterium bins.68]
MGKKLNWLTTAQICAALELTPRQLRRKLPDLKPGIHYREIGKPDAIRKTYQWNLPNLAKKLNL